MPTLVSGVADEVLCAALAAAAAPLAVAMSPAFWRRCELKQQQQQLHQQVRLAWWHMLPSSSNVGKVVGLLLAKVKLWLLRCVLRHLSDSARTKQVLPSLPSPGSSVDIKPQARASAACLKAKLLQADCPAFLLPASSCKPMKSTADGSRPYAAAAASLGAPLTHGNACVSDRAGNEEEGAEETCAICHDTFTLPCEADCGHSFCAECILSVWQHGSALSACRCPICRRNVASITPNATAGSSSLADISKNAVYGARARELLHDVAKYNRLFGGEKYRASLWQRLSDVPLLLRRLMRDLADPCYAISVVHSARFALFIAVGATHLLAPLNIVPKRVMGVLGNVDDAAFGVCAVLYLTALYGATCSSSSMSSSSSSNAD